MNILTIEEGAVINSDNKQAYYILGNLCNAIEKDKSINNMKMINYWLNKAKDLFNFDGEFNIGNFNTGNFKSLMQQLKDGELYEKGR